MPEGPSHAFVLYWQLWFYGWSISFLVPELTELARGNAQNTLSSAVWTLEKVTAGQSISNWTFFHFAFTGFFILLAIWLSGHFGWGFWR
jgi:hypothetical protein